MKRLRIALLWIGAVPLMHAVGAADALAGEAGGAAQAPTTRLLRAAEVKPEIGYLRGTNAGGTPAPAAPTAQDLAAHRVDPGVGGAPTTQPDNASTTPPDNAQTGSGSSPGTGNDDRRVGRPLEAPVEAPAEVEAPSAGEDAAATDPSGNRERSARDGRSETGHGARNENLTVQVILQIQRGCRRYCYGVSQLQSASQLATTTQSASGATGAAGRSAAGSTLPSVGNLPPASDRQATALNRSRTIQFVWQMQIGCVAFCYGTSQSQVATQTTHSTQQAMATVTGGALAANDAADM